MLDSDCLCLRLFLLAVPGIQAVLPGNAAALGGLTPSMPAQLGVASCLEVMLETGGPACALMDLAEKQAKLEEEQKAATKSPLLQALVQVRGLLL